MNADQKWKQEYQQQKHKQKIQQAKATLPQDCRSLKTTGSTRAGLETRTTYQTNIQKDEIVKPEDSAHQRGRGPASFEDRVVQYQEPLFDTLKERGLQQYSKELNSRGYGNIVEVVSRFNNDDFESLLSSLKVLPGHNDKFRQLRSDVLRELPEINPNKKKVRETSERPYIEQRVDENKKARLQSQGSGANTTHDTFRTHAAGAIHADGLQKVAKGRKLRGVRIKEIGADYFLDSTDLSREQRELVEELCSNIQRVEREYVVHSEDDTDPAYGTKTGPIRHKPSVETNAVKIAPGKNEVYEGERKSKTAPSNPGAYTLKGPVAPKRRNPNLPPINDHNPGRTAKTSDFTKTKVANQIDADKELDEYLDDQTSNDIGPHEGYPRANSKGRSDARSNSKPTVKGSDYPPKQQNHGTKTSHKASQASQPSHPSYAKASTAEPHALSSPSNHTRHHQSQYKQSIEVHSIGSGGDAGHRRPFDTSDDGEIEDLTGKLGSHEDNFNEYIDHDAVYLQQPVKVSNARNRSSDKARGPKEVPPVPQRRNSRGPVPKPPKANNLLPQTAEQRNQVSANSGGPGALAQPRGRSQNRSLKDESGKQKLNATAPNTHQTQQPATKKEPRRSDSQGRGMKAVVPEPKVRTAPTPPGRPPIAGKGPAKPSAPKPAVKPPKKFQSQELRGGASTDQEEYHEEMHPGKRFEEEFEDLTDNPPVEDFDDEFEETPDEIVDQVDFEEVFTYENNPNSPGKVSSSYDEKFATKHFNALKPAVKAGKPAVSQKPAEDKLKSKITKDKTQPQTSAKDLKAVKPKGSESRPGEQPSALGVKQPSSKQLANPQNGQSKNKEFGAPNVQAKQPQEVNPVKMKKAHNPALVIAEEGPAVMKTAEPKETRIPARASEAAKQDAVREESIRSNAGAKKLISQPHLKGDSSEADMLEHAEQLRREPASSARQKSNRSDTTDTKDHLSEGKGEDPSPQTPDSNHQQRISAAIEQKKKQDKIEDQKHPRSSKSLPLPQEQSIPKSETDDVRHKLIQRMNKALEYIQTEEKPGELNMRFADIKKDVYKSFDGVKLTSTILNIDIDELCYCYGKVIIQHLLNFRDMEVSQEEEMNQKPQSHPKGTLEEQDITESIAIIGKTIQDRLQGDLQANLSDHGGVQESGLMLDDSDSAPQQKLEIISERSEDTDSQAHLQSGKEPLPSPKISDSRIQYLDDDIDPNDIMRLSMSIKTRYEYIFEDDPDVKTMKAHQVFDRVFNDEEIYSEIPEVEVIRDYVLDIIISCKMEKEILMASLVYLERVLIRNDYPLTMQNWRRLVIISLIIASKIWDDESFENHNFAKVFSTYETEDINEMERMFLERIDYDLEIPTVDYTKYYFVLRVFADKRHRGPQLRELDLPTVLQLQNDPRNAKENLMERYGQPLLKSYGG